ncbi:hypothetical protein GTO87_01835 [Ligilactobacillus saerimneri]|uniref:Uncharacterized protein n=1 Tax=Ligilactobacillus saerimneri TaxID=228229 RepID=A0A7H9EIE1_9LACO|nr:hypothetical protein [Ligilactobacillus saerimneri]QLL77468.1 hypothetical protein GTO87_01835 [Ligilactobacillus saerimneri]
MKAFKMVDNKNNRYLITADSITDLTKYVDETKASDGWLAGCIGQFKYEDDEPQLIGYTTMIKASCIRRIEQIEKQTFIIDIKKAFDEEC